MRVRTYRTSLDGRRLDRRAIAPWNAITADRALATTAEIGHHASVTEVPAGNALQAFASAGHVAIVSAETQTAALLTVDSVGVLSADERRALRTTGAPAWFPPEPVRDELALLRVRCADADLAAIDSALVLVEYACSTGTGVAIVPPPQSA